jgi:molybdate transport system regulatory protein
MDISYRRAWLLLDSLNKSFDMPATVNSVGGRGGGGAEITPFGLLLIQRYREVERKEYRHIRSQGICVQEASEGCLNFIVRGSLPDAR